MAPIIIFAEEKNGKVTLTKEELQKLVDEAYWNGRRDATNGYLTVTPRWDYDPYKVTCTSTGTTP